MLAFIGKSLDRLLFACIFISAVQLPEFIQQYSQRLAGHLDEAKYQLIKFQDIANIHYQGNLMNLISQYQTNTDPAINATGQMVVELIDRIALLSNQVQHLFHSDYLSKVYYFFSHFDADIANATLRDYQLSIPLEQNALLTGALVAVIVSLISSATFSAMRLRTS